jgi:hypothetical protein
MTMGQVKVVNLDELLPPDLTVRFRGRTYTLPGDLPLDLLLRIGRQIDNAAAPGRPRAPARRAPRASRERGHEGARRDHRPARARERRRHQPPAGAVGRADAPGRQIQDWAP